MNGLLLVTDEVKMIKHGVFQSSPWWGYETKWTVLGKRQLCINVLLFRFSFKSFLLTLSLWNERIAFPTHVCYVLIKQFIFNNKLMCIMGKD